MYSFYEDIKKEIDLQDLVGYLVDPLNRLKILELKLSDYRKQNKNIIETEILLNECHRLSENIFPDLIRNYRKLSFRFRNNIVIKQIKDSNDKKLSLTSKDVLLKNVGKLIEHIQVIENKFDKNYSFDLLVDSRIISELGFQENFLDSPVQSIDLENKYQFSSEDSNDFTSNELKKILPRIEPIKIESEIPKKYQQVGKADPISQSLSLAKKDEELELEIFNKKEIKTDNEVKLGAFACAISLIFFVLSLSGTNSIFSGNDSGFIKQPGSEISLSQGSSNYEIQKALDIMIEKNRINNFVYKEGVDGVYKQTTMIMNNLINIKEHINSKSSDYTVKYTDLIKDGFRLQEGQILFTHNTIQEHGIAYTINIVNNKALLKVQNASQESCKYASVKLYSTYNVTVNGKRIESDNLSQACQVSGEILFQEK